MFVKKLKTVLATSGDRIAICSSSSTITYAELSRNASTLALELLERDIGPGKLVAIYGPRQPVLVTCMIAAMLAGAAYTVVEASDSSEEERYRLRQIAPDFVLYADDAGQLSGATDIPWMSTANLPQVTVVKHKLPTIPEDAVAYVIYTSGSTGKPKGVAVTHGNLSHYCKGLATRLEVPAYMTFAHVSTLSADLGNTCLFLSLWTAGTLYLADEFERKDPSALASALVTHRVDVLKITPTHWRSILAACAHRMAGAAPLQWLILGGERLQAELARATLDSQVTDRLLNHYGPTETTIGVTVHPVLIDDLHRDSSDSIPIGRPFGQTTLHVLGADGKFSATDTEGELYIGGPSVAQGYWKRPDLTAERFATPDQNFRRCYRTGDRVRIDSSGLVTFLGRMDRQVKVNGYRVELEHVEHAICQVTGAQLATVAHHRQNERDYLLCAYEGADCDSTSIRARLQQHLPAHMVPTVFLYYEKLPTNPNGKLDIPAIRTPLVTFLQSQHAPAPLTSEGPSDMTLESRLLDMFSRYSGCHSVTVDDNFFEIGADSLDAIQLVSELQFAGFSVTAHSFLACPTVQGLMTTIQGREIPQPRMRSKSVEPAKQHPCSPAQEWFFAQHFPEPNRWTQAILLELGITLDRRLLGLVLERVIGEQSSLRLRFVRDESSDTWFFEPTACPEHVLSVHAETNIPAEELAGLIEVRYRNLESTLNILAGKVFSSELISVGPRQYLLLVAHHLVIDVISWRILLDELMRHYAVATGSELETHTRPSTPFGVWTHDLHERRLELVTDLQHWPQCVSTTDVRSFSGGMERDARTAWLALSPIETAVVTQAAASLSATVDHLILARFIEQCVQTWPEEVLRVQVESHGRLNASDDIDVSRTIGWFTSAFPVCVQNSEVSNPQFPALLHARLRAIPNLGHAYGLHNPGAPSTPYCFNFLGQSRLGLRNDWKARAASVALPGLRGEQNDRVYRLKLTGRLVDGVLILDLNFDGAAYAPSTISAFLVALRQRLAGSIDPPSDWRPIGLPTFCSSSSGALWNIPAKVTALNAEPGRRRSYANILLTGITGFIGIHVLRELLLHTRAHLYCIVREMNGVPPAARLHEVWNAFFGSGELDSQMHRVSILPGDITQPSLGLSAEVWDKVSMGADAIYHLAADTRLVGSRRDMEAGILQPVLEILRLTSEGKDKDLHFISTLAVSGACDAGDPSIFDEGSLNIGQTFFNEYERAKFEAEHLVRDFAYLGHSTFIYRPGNVTGDSRTGQFQRNAAANRWVQCLRAITCAGYAPRAYRDSITLSPVDVVARGIVSLSLNPDLTGGTFHVDSEHAVPASHFVDALEAVGLPVRYVETERLDEALEASGKLGEHDIAIGYFWATRGSRNVHYDNSKTLALLACDDIHFPPITPAWIYLFVSRLYHSGVLGPSQSTDTKQDTASVEVEAN